MTEAQAPAPRFDDLRRAYDLIAKTPIGRYVIAIPTALTLVANFDGIGDMADNVVRYWRPVVQGIGRLFGKLLPLPLSPQDYANLLFLTPFVVLGVWDVIRDRAPKPSFPGDLLTVALFVVLAFNVIGTGVDLATLSICSLLTAGLAFLLRLVVRRLAPQRGRWPVFALPLASFVVFTTFGAMGYALPPGRSMAEHVLRLFLACVALFALPMLAGGRIRVVALLVFAVLAISFVHAQAAGWFHALVGS